LLTARCEIRANPVQLEIASVAFPERANDHLRRSWVIIAFVAKVLEIRKCRIGDRMFATIASEIESKLFCLMNHLFHCDLHSPAATNRNENRFGQWLAGQGNCLLDFPRKAKDGQQIEVVHERKTPAAKGEGEENHEHISRGVSACLIVVRNGIIIQ
jgi:hypothetical protein